MGLRSYISLIVTILVTITAVGQTVQKDSLLLALRYTNIPSEKVTILNQLASVFLEEDPVRAENYASQALFISESIQDQQGRSEAYYYLGHLAWDRKEYDKSLDYLKMAEEGFIAEDDEIGLARVYLLLNDAYKRKLEYEKALKMLFQAMETFKKEGRSKELGETYNAIGGNFYDQGNLEKAFEYFSNSLEIFADLGETILTGALYNNIGEIYRLKKDYTKAISYYKKSLLIFLEFNEEVRLSMIYTNLGNTYLEKAQIDSAEYFLSLGLELSDYTRDVNRMSSVRISIGKLHLARGDLERAHEKIKQGYDLALQGSSNSNTALAARLLSDLYTLENNYEQAYTYFVRFRNIDDSVHNIKNLEKITQMEMNLLFDLENEVRKIQVQRTNLRYFTIAFILISIIVLAVLFYGRQRIKANQNRTMGENLQMEKEQLQEEIEFKNRELATNVMFLVKKNELINFISEKLLRVKSDFKPSVRKAVDEILIDLQSNIDQNIWNVFEERFREVHSDFYDNLVKQFPNLTDNDKKLCAFIRLNMNTKEIAAITHQNPNSIEVARTRLRKKLNISNTDISLNGFLSQI
jgi:tetratricopeptide (TPR) repeat protein